MLQLCFTSLLRTCNWKMYATMVVPFLRPCNCHFSAILAVPFLRPCNCHFSAILAVPFLRPCNCFAIQAVPCYGRVMHLPFGLCLFQATSASLIAITASLWCY